MEKTVILISGEMGIGKDTTADILNKKYPEAFRWAFAYPLKQLLIKCLSLFLNKDFTEKQIDCYKNKGKKVFLIKSGPQYVFLIGIFAFLSFTIEEKILLWFFAFCSFIAYFQTFIWLSMRNLLQSLGSSCRDIFGKDIFIRTFLSKWTESGKQIAIVSDCRFDELEQLKQYTELNVIHIIIRGKPRIYVEHQNHVTEIVPTDKSSIIIDNSRDIDFLSSQLSIVDDILNR